MDTANAGRAVANPEINAEPDKMTRAYQGGFFDMHMLEKAFVALLNHKAWVIGSILA